MDTILLVIGILGLGAIVIAAYVFLGSARHYLSGDEDSDQLNSRPTPNRHHAERSPTDRRQVAHFNFPLTIAGIFIPSDRRIIADRRLVAA